MTLPLGSYHVEETAPPYGFVGTRQSYDVTFAWDNQLNDVVMATTITTNPGDGSASQTSTYPIINVTDATDAEIEAQVLHFYNERVKPQLDIYKQDIETDQPLAGAVYNLYTVDDIYSATDGYAIAESIRFKLVQRKDENGDLLNETDVYVCTGKDWLIFDHWTLMEDGTVIMRDALAPETPNQPTPAPTPTTTTVTATPKPVAHVPQTGDSTPLLAMVIVTALAAVGFVALLVVRCRRNRLEEETDPQLEPRDDMEDTHE